MGWFRRSGQAARDTDPLFSWGERIGKLLWEFFKWVVGPSTVSGLALVGLGWATYGLFYGALAGAVAFALIQLSLTLRLFRNSAVEARLPTEPQPETGTPQSTSADAPTDTNSRQEQEATIELGNTAPLFLLGGRFIPEDDSERRTISLPTLIEKWALWPFIESGRTFVAKGAEFENCDIYGPGVFVLAEGTVADTFYKCDWEEEWQAFWPATKRGRYIGVIALENCKFRRCNFKGVAFVVKPDEFRRLYRRLTGDDLN